jgi:splicing suppressor protein 51
MTSCSSCSKDETSNVLKACAKCQSAFYCNRECQKSHWKVHKKECARLAGERSGGNSGSSKGLSKAIDKPFANLQAKTWLHNRPEEDVYKLLVDIYRLRADDEFKFQGSSPRDSLYGGASSGLEGFNKFLKLVARPNLGILPSWWAEESETKCRETGQAALAKKLEKSDAIKEYGEQNMPMQMRMIGEDIYGTSAFGQGSGGMGGKDEMLDMQVRLERGNSGFQSVHIDASKMMFGS